MCDFCKAYKYELIDFCKRGQGAMTIVFDKGINAEANIAAITAWRGSGYAA